MFDVASFRNRSPGERPVPSLRLEPASLVRWWTDRRDERRSYRQVQDLSLHLLDDIGLLQTAEPQERR